MHHLFRIKPSPRNLISLVADCCTRLANKINAARVDQSANLDSSGWE
jgi:hypothetical protein